MLVGMCVGLIGVLVVGGFLKFSIVRLGVCMYVGLFDVCFVCLFILVGLLVCSLVSVFVWWDLLVGCCCLFANLSRKETETGKGLYCPSMAK